MTNETCPICNSSEKHYDGSIAHTGPCFEVVGTCDLCNGVVREFTKHKATAEMQHLECVKRQNAQEEFKQYLKRTLTQDMVKGFTHISVHTIYAIAVQVGSEGSCWLAYDRPQLYIQDQINLLQPKLSLILAQDVDSEVWQELDYEIIELSVALLAMRLCCTEKLFWCSACTKLSTEKFECHHPDTYFSIDFTAVEGSLYN